MQPSFVVSKIDAPKGFYKQDNTTPNDVVVLESKQNSDAAGLLYQGMRKDPFTFATKGTGVNGYGLNPLKIYNAQGKEIVQTLDGTTDTNGGITIVKESASSMLETVRKPNTFYAAGDNAIINQTGLTKDVFNYYWTAYSRSTDGGLSPIGDNKYTYSPNLNISYIDGYNQQRPKSIFDSCPYGFRVPVNGTFNLFHESYIAWTKLSYTSGVIFSNTIKDTWLIITGFRSYNSGLISEVGLRANYLCSNSRNISTCSGFDIRTDNILYVNSGINYAHGTSVRCIEEWFVCKKS